MDPCVVCRMQCGSTRGYVATFDSRKTSRGTRWGWVKSLYVMGMNNCCPETNFLVKGMGRKVASPGGHQPRRGGGRVLCEV